VIGAYNEEQYIGRLLVSLQRQTVTPLEVIVADDGSRDRTPQIARHQGARVLSLAHRGPAAARNAGAREARGDVLVFADGDMVCGREYVERLARPIVNGEAVGTFTRDIFLGNPENRWARAYATLRRSPPDRLLPADFPDRWENFRAVRRDRFLEVGGYDDVGYGEDMTLAPKLGELAVVAPGAVCFHYHPSSVREIWQNGRWVGRGAAIRTMPDPWRAHSPMRILRASGEEIRRGRTPWVFPARLAYHSGVWVGLAQSSIRPGRHWK
jgi:glycosyltransferase involved in cell wall biosynthesis